MSGLVTLGETMASLTPDQIGPLRHARSLGVSMAGSESNVAIGVRRLGHESTWIGRVGRDELGELIRTRLRGEGVTVHGPVDPTAPTGLMLKERRAAGIRRVYYYRAASAGSRLCPDDLPDDLVESAAILHVTGITLALSDTAARTVVEAVRRARSAGATVSLDLNYRARLWSEERARAALLPLLASVDICFASDDEARLLLGDLPGSAGELTAQPPERLAELLREQGPDTVVITMGAAGALATSPRGTVAVPAVVVAEADPVGAGDAFVAGYLAAMLDGGNDKERAATAAAVAAMSVSTEGDWEGLPTREELELIGLPQGTVTR